MYVQYLVGKVVFSNSRDPRSGYHLYYHLNLFTGFLNDQSRPLLFIFIIFISTMTNLAQILTITGSVDGVHGIRTQDRRMVGVHKRIHLAKAAPKCVYCLYAQLLQIKA